MGARGERRLRSTSRPLGAARVAGNGFASAADFKAPERRKIAEQGYSILLSMGDQASDLEGGFAERTFKLPNPVYYLP